MGVENSRIVRKGAAALLFAGMFSGVPSVTDSQPACATQMRVDISSLPSGHTSYDALQINGETERRMSAARTFDTILKRSFNPAAARLALPSIPYSIRIYDLQYFDQSLPCEEAERLAYLATQAEFPEDGSLAFETYFRFPSHALSGINAKFFRDGGVRITAKTDKYAKNYTLTSCFTAREPRDLDELSQALTLYTNPPEGILTTTERTSREPVFIQKGFKYENSATIITGNSTCITLQQISKP